MIAGRLGRAQRHCSSSPRQAPSSGAPRAPARPRSRAPSAMAAAPAASAGGDGALTAAHLALAHELADAAGRITSRYFRSARLSVDSKSDASPVTIADREAEAEMRRLIAGAFPEHSVFGEEAGLSLAGDGRWLWVLDPIDGTKSFITGKPLFGTLIALLRDGAPVLGIIDQPITRERWVGAAGQPTALNGAPVAARRCASVGDAYLYATTPHMFAPGRTEQPPPAPAPRARAQAFARVRDAARVPLYGCDCYAYGLLAAGQVDLVVEADLKPYDYMALVPIVTGAGGVITDWAGQLLRWSVAGGDVAAAIAAAPGEVLAAGDAATHAQALELLAWRGRELHIHLALAAALVAVAAARVPLQAEPAAEAGALPMDQHCEWMPPEPEGYTHDNWTADWPLSCMGTVVGHACVANCHEGYFTPKHSSPPTIYCHPWPHHARGQWAKHIGGVCLPIPPVCNAPLPGFDHARALPGCYGLRRGAPLGTECFYRCVKGLHLHLVLLAAALVAAAAARVPLQAAEVTAAEPAAAADPAAAKPEQAYLTCHWHPPYPAGYTAKNWTATWPQSCMGTRTNQYCSAVCKPGYYTPRYSFPPRVYCHEEYYKRWGKWATNIGGLCIPVPPPPVLCRYGPPGFNHARVNATCFPRRHGAELGTNCSYTCDDGYVGDPLPFATCQLAADNKTGMWVWDQTANCKDASACGDNPCRDIAFAIPDSCVSIRFNESYSCTCLDYYMWDGTAKVCLPAKLVGLALGQPVDAPPGSWIFKYGSRRPSDVGNARWIVQDNGTTPLNLNDLAIVDEDNAWAVGQQGLIKRLVAGVWTVARAPDPAAPDLLAVAALSNTKAWFGGKGGTALFWNGRGFDDVSVAGGRDITSIAALPDVVWAVAADEADPNDLHGYIYRWQNQARSWGEPVEVGNATLRGVAALDAQGAWAVGYTSRGRVEQRAVVLSYNATNGTWEHVDASAGGLPYARLSDVVAVDYEHIYAAGTWQSASSQSGSESHGLVMSYNGRYWGTPFSGGDVERLVAVSSAGSPSTVVAVGAFNDRAAERQGWGYPAELWQKQGWNQRPQTNTSVPGSLAFSGIALNSAPFSPKLARVALKNWTRRSYERGGGSAAATAPVEPEPAAAPAAGAGRCPVLAALPTPPPAAHAWWQRPLQILDPERFQRASAEPHALVSAPAQLGLPAQIQISDGDLARAVLAAEADGGDVAQGVGALRGFSALLGRQSLVNVQEPRHAYLRGLIMPAFSPAAIEALLPRMTEVLGRYLAAWAAAGGAGRAVGAADGFKEMTFVFIIAVILGADPPAAEVQRLRRLYLAWADGLLAFPYVSLPFTRYGRALAARRDLIAWLQAAVDGARAALARRQPVGGILGGLVAAVDDGGNTLTDEEITDNLLLLLLAGHDTSASSLTAIIANLSDHPQAWARLRAEQEALAARHGAALSGSALRDMEWADAVIRESLRLRAVVPALTRRAARDFELGGYRIAAGSFLFLPLALLSRSDPRWPGGGDGNADGDAWRFRPERMLGPDGGRPGWQMPFGGGPRFCAGYAVAMAEMKVFLALLARGYDFTADTDTTWRQRIGPQPANGLPLTVTRRALAAAPARGSRSAREQRRRCGDAAPVLRVRLRPPPFAVPVMPSPSGRALARHALALAAALALLLAAAPAGGAAARGPRRGLLADVSGSRGLLATTAEPAANCTPGNGVSAGGGECAPCKRGTWSPGGLGAKCQACRKGYNTAGEGAQAEWACGDCRAGYGRDPHVQARRCAPCPPGMWRSAKPGQGIKPCRACPPLTTTSGPGAKSIAACNVTLALPDDPVASALLRGLLELAPGQLGTNFLTTWRPDTDPCTWQGVFCTDSTPRVVKWVGVAVAGTGRLPRAWAELGAGLEGLSITINGQTKAGSGLADPSWPAEWRNLTGLKGLSLGNVGMTGAPPLTALPPSVERVDLMNNRFTSLGNDVAPGALPALVELTIQQDPAHPIGGTLPASWGALSSLQKLGLKNLALTGPLPASWSGMAALTTLDLSANALSGPLPEAWAGLAALQELHLNGNALGGPLPAAWGDGMAALTTLYLSGNALTGPLPAAWGDGMAALTTLDLSHNAITGPLPDAWGGLASIEWRLDLSYNKLSGPIPEAWAGGLAALRQLDLSHNALSGSLPARALSNVPGVDLSYNQLTGRVSDWAGWATVMNCYQVEFPTLNLAHNQLTGPLPEAPGRRAGLIDLSDNALTSTLPAAWANWPLCQGCYAGFTLNLAGNQLRGPLPPEWGNWSSPSQTTLYGLNLTGNPLNATLPPEWSGMRLGMLDSAVAARPGRPARLARTRSASRPVMPSRSGRALARHALALAAAALALLLAAAPAGGAAARGPSRRGLLADGSGSRSLLVASATPAAECLPGSGVSAGAGDCALCKRGSWSPGGPDARCRGCPKGRTTAHEGTTSPAACSDCRAGYGLALAGGTCEPCPTGTWANSKPGAGIRPCNTCPALTTTPGPGAKSAAACNETLSPPDDPLGAILRRGLEELGLQRNEPIVKSWRAGTEPCTWQGGRLPRAWGELGPGLEAASLGAIQATDVILSAPSWPAEWRNLTGLKTLELQNVGVTGPLPLAALPPSVERVFFAGTRFASLADDVARGALPALRLLRVYQDPAHSIDGTLPASWGALTALEELALSLAISSPDAPLPDWRGMVSLKKLELFELGLTGALSLAALPSSVETVSFADCRFTSLADDLAPGALPALRSLRVRQDRAFPVGGVLPATWGALTALEALALQLLLSSADAPLPDWHGMARLKTLDLSGLGLTGRLSLAALPPRVDRVTIVNARFTSLADDLAPGALPVLRKLRVSQDPAHHIGGTLPASWGALTVLQSLDLHGQVLTGSLPSAWGAGMANLTTLDLSSNSLSGAVPEAWAGMAALSSVYLQNNALSGSLPPRVFMNNVKVLDLSHNQLTGPIDGWAGWAAGSTPRLCGRALNLAHNQLTGPLPEAPGGWAGKIDLSGNALTSTLPAAWARWDVGQGCSGYIWLNLADNQLCGPLPPEWGTWSATLNGLNLTGNPLGATLPPEWSGMRLRALDVSSNLLKDKAGSAPAERAARRRRCGRSSGGPAEPERSASPVHEVGGGGQRELADQLAAQAALQAQFAALHRQQCAAPAPGRQRPEEESDALLDFWVVLTTTQGHLQDILVDLETARLELALARGRADDAEGAACALRAQLAAARHANAALQGQLVAARGREAAAGERAATLVTRNAELAAEAAQAQQAAAGLELRLERLRSAPAAAAAGAPEAAHEAAAAQQLRGELSACRSDLAAAQCRAARAELELVVARTRALVAQQESATSAERCAGLERTAAGLAGELGAAHAAAEAAAAARAQLEAEVAGLAAKLEQRDARLRGSMTALARASSTLRTSFTAAGGGPLDQGLLRASAAAAADAARRAAELRAGKAPPPRASAERSPFAAVAGPLAQLGRRASGASSISSGGGRPELDRSSPVFRQRVPASRSAGGAAAGARARSDSGLPPRPRTASRALRSPLVLSPRPSSRGSSCGGEAAEELAAAAPRGSDGSSDGGAGSRQLSAGGVSSLLAATSAVPELCSALAQAPDAGAAEPPSGTPAAATACDAAAQAGGAALPAAPARGGAQPSTRRTRTRPLVHRVALAALLPAGAAALAALLGCAGALAQLRGQLPRRAGESAAQPSRSAPGPEGGGARCAGEERSAPLQAGVVGAAGAQPLAVWGLYATYGGWA
ncbi:HISN7 [Scenedesmus sp. PABB004]|nr:HISN7 [Scenedesmus sp. PABB004]